MSLTHDPDENNSARSVFIPVNSAGIPIKWNENDAAIPGVLAAVEEHFLSNYIFQELFTHNAVTLSSGKMAITSANAVHFFEDETRDPRDFKDPCPDTEARFKQYNAKMTKASKTALLNFKASK